MSNNTSHFERLGEIALRQYGIKHAALEFISGTDNMVFRVHAPDQQYVLRIDQGAPTPGALSMLKGELLWLNAIRRDTDLLAPEPVATLDHTWVAVVALPAMTEALPATPEVHPATLLRWLPGSIVGEQTTPDIAAGMGAFMARLHDHTGRFRLPADADRSHTNWNKLAYWQDRRNDTSKTLTPEQRDVCAAASAQLLADIEQIGAAQDYGLIHADLHPHNCLLHEGQLGVLDFGDCRYASHFYDMAVPLVYLRERPDYETLRAAFLEGYSRVRPLPTRCESALDVFMAARAFDNIEWIHFDWPNITHLPFGPALVDVSVRQIHRYLELVAR